jgi:hypothetical protein
MRAAVRSTGMFGVKLPLPVDIASVPYYADVDQASAVVQSRRRRGSLRSGFSTDRQRPAA